MSMLHIFCLFQFTFAAISDIIAHRLDVARLLERPLCKHRADKLINEHGEQHEELLQLPSLSEEVQVH